VVSHPIFDREEIMFNKARKVLAASLLSMAGLSAGAANIVQNPGFELGSAYWTSDLFLVGNDPLWAHTGPGMVRTTCTGAHCVNSLMEGAYISQLLPTIAGTEYDLSFWVRSFKGQGQYSVFWDGALVDDILLAQNGPMTQTSFSGLYASANATLLEIHGRHDLHWISFDDFSVQASGSPAVPPPGQFTLIGEPAAYTLVLAGLALVGAFRRR
jgi:hypothetical protein